MNIKSFSEDNAKELCSWKYDGQYKVYNFPEWKEVCLQNWAIASDKKRKSEFISIYEGEEFIGFVRFIKNEYYYTVGLGLKPSYCGKGYGMNLMDLIKETAVNNKIKRLVMEVRCFNKRAVKCYKRAGFAISNKITKNTLIGKSDFYEMEILL